MLAAVRRPHCPRIGVIAKTRTPVPSAVVAHAPERAAGPAEGGDHRGVDASVLLSPDVFDDARAAVDEDRATLTVAQGPFELRITGDAYGNFYLIDGEEVCQEVADPLAPDRLFDMLDLRDRGLAARVRDGFEAAWADPTVVDEV
jgi:hypothetical protein